MIKIENVSEYTDRITLENEEENKVIKVKNEDVYLGRRAGTVKGKFTLEDLEIADEPVEEETIEE